MHAGIHRGPRLGLLSAAVLLLAACGSGSGSSSSNTSPLLVGILSPFTGPDAGFGPADFASCLPAARVINAAGGVMGHQLTCQQFDTRGEPADAVPATDQMLASNSNLIGVVGCHSDEAASTIPILEHAHIPSVCMTGQSEFNKSSFRYFHRLVPPDEFDSYALVGSALDVNHFKRIALVFGNDIGSQAFVQPAMTSLQALGGTVTINQSLALGAPSYRTEVTAMLATHPDAIFTEALGSADATYLAEVKQLNGSLIPFMGTASTIDPVWFKAVSDAIGIPDMLKYYQGIDLGVTFSGTAYDEFKTNLLASTAQFAAAPTYVERGSTLHLYDGIMMMALAMDETHSTDPKVFNAKIKDIGNGVSGSVLVHTYKEGVDAINSGKTVRWAGAGGLTQFNQWNNSQQGYIIVKYDAQGNEVKIGELTKAQTDAVIAAGGGG